MLKGALQWPKAYIGASGSNEIHQSLSSLSLPYDYLQQHHCCHCHKILPSKSFPTLWLSASLSVSPSLSSSSPPPSMPSPNQDLYRYHHQHQLSLSLYNICFPLPLLFVLIIAVVRIIIIPLIATQNLRCLVTDAHVIWINYWHNQCSLCYMVFAFHNHLPWL